ncbi:unnamed protein product, partial [Gongylonema pulchrum]|uniref:7TM_GPCR_Srx domain-containing protein n=1 Tax=Gongylonema pulchrum TaxID=637853 RepID=A0A183CXI0_9BILA
MIAFVLQTCNVILIIVGLTAVGLAGSQFSEVSLGNYRKIDLRLLNWIYVLTGLVGLYTLARNQGIIVAKTLYCVSVIQYASIRNKYVAKLFICSLMIVVPAGACLAAVIAAALLDRLVIVTQPTWPQYSRDQDKKYRASRLKLTAFAAIKLFLALGALALAIFLEYDHQLVLGTDAFVVIGLDHITALLAITSAIVDLHSASDKCKLNLKKSDITSIVWGELRALNLPQSIIILVPMTTVMVDVSYAIIIVEGILVGLFALLFALNLLTALQAGKCVQCLGLLHLIWALFLMALVVLGLVDVSWNANYIGADLFWLTVLIFATGLLYMVHSSTQLSAQFVLGFICFTCALEKTCSSINLVYQAATYPAFTRSPEDAYIGRLVLHCVQLAVLAFETLTGLLSVILFGRALKRHYRFAAKHTP